MNPTALLGELDSKPIAVTLTYVEWLRVRTLVRIAGEDLQLPADDLITKIADQNVYELWH